MPIDASDVLDGLTEMLARTADGSIPLAAFDRETKAIMGHQWVTRGKATGGVVRGRVWRGYADQYTRKTDGRTVPAWGGTPRIDGKGAVQPRRRPSGEFVTQYSVLNADTGRLKNAILSDRPDITAEPGRWVLKIGAQLPKYAEHVLVDLDRNILEWVPGDEERLHEKVDAYHVTLVDGFNRSGGFRR